MNLSFGEKAILTLYRRFYKYPYPAIDKKNTDAHIQAQKMGFILSLCSISAGDYGYMWDSYGPCSPALQDELKYLDKNADMVELFYEQNPTDAKLFTANDDYSGLFSVEQGKQIDIVATKLKLREHLDDLRNWSELLGSLAFLYCCDMPNATFGEVSDELSSRKPQFSDRKQNLQAWRALAAANII